MSDPTMDVEAEGDHGEQDLARVLQVLGNVPLVVDREEEPIDAGSTEPILIPISKVINRRLATSAFMTFDTAVGPQKEIFDKWFENGTIVMMALAGLFDEYYECIQKKFAIMSRPPINDNEAAFDAARKQDLQIRADCLPMEFKEAKREDGYFALVFLTHLIAFKANSTNVALVKRYSAGLASLGIKNSTMEERITLFLSQSRSINDNVAAINATLTRYDIPRLLFVNCIGRAGLAYKGSLKAISGQVALVAEYSGMTHVTLARKLMESRSAITIHRAILEEYGALLKTIDELKANYGKYWVYSKILLLPGSELLNTRRFPTLVQASFEYAKIREPQTMRQLLLKVPDSKLTTLEITRLLQIDRPEEGEEARNESEEGRSENEIRALAILNYDITKVPKGQRNPVAPPPTHAQMAAAMQAFFTQQMAAATAMPPPPGTSQQ